MLTKPYSEKIIKCPPNSTKWVTNRSFVIQMAPGVRGGEKGNADVRRTMPLSSAVACVEAYAEFDSDVSPSFSRIWSRKYAHVSHYTYFEIPFASIKRIQDNNFIRCDPLHEEFAPRSLRGAPSRRTGVTSRWGQKFSLTRHARPVKAATTLTVAALVSI